MNEALNSFETVGTLLPSGGHHPFWVDDEPFVWWVSAGQADLFAVSRPEDGGARRHLLRVPAGAVLFGWPRDEGSGWPRIQAVGGGDARIHRLPLDRFRELATNAELREHLAHWVDEWIDSIYHGLVGSPAPTDARIAVGGGTFVIETGTTVRPDDQVVWCVAGEAQLFLDGIPELMLSGPGDGWPVSPTGWLKAGLGGAIEFAHTADWLERPSFWADLNRFHRLAHRWMARRLGELRSSENARLMAKTRGQIQARRHGMERLSQILLTGSQPDSVAETSGDALLAAVQLIAADLGVPFSEGTPLPIRRSQEDLTAQLNRLPRLRARRVVLRPNWWQRDGGPLLALRQDSGAPVALIQRTATRYELLDPAEGTRTHVDGEVAATLGASAFTFYPGFGEQVLKVLDVFRFGFHGVRGELALVVTLSLSGVLLGLVVPIVTGLIFDQVIPAADRHQLWFLAAALAVAAFSDILLDVTRAIAMVRIETKSETGMQAAVWDRLLRLPAPFFREFTSGDLADRAQGINGIRSILTGAMMGSLLSGVFSLVSFALLCYYNVSLSLIAMALVAVNLSVTGLVSGIALTLERPVYRIGGKLSGQVLQFVTGITKLRVAGAEAHAFAVWARNFSEFKRLDLRTERLANLHGVFLDIFPLATSIVLFGAMTSIAGNELSIGRFLAFSAAFMTFLNATINASVSLISLASAIPLYERTKPILEAQPEPSEGKLQPGSIKGRIEFSHINFRYKPGDPLVLHDLSLQIRPGEFVAVVGPSGSGKSTLTRLLLGFEKPESGTVLLDGLDLAGLDIQMVRRQFGVVLQGGKLMPGDIFRNIVGNSLLTLDDAWDAARLAGLEEDIRDMPMGMHTVLGEGSGTLSGGQRQRLMIARAIVNRPRVLIFDEATSALDNRTQDIVTRSLESLKVTRIVVAHRLSTIQSADRIYVIEKGHLVQTGTFAQLRDQPGPFANMMKRQIA